MVGIDEAGRGPIAGPIVAAAVVLPVECDLKGLDDSKVLSEAKREVLARQIEEVCVAFVVVKLQHSEIDRYGVGEANRQLFRECFEKLSMTMKRNGLFPDFVVIDGRHSVELPIEHEYVIDGDARVKSIAAASILAKVFRDKLMVGYDRRHPGYGFGGHKGYGTKAHWEAIDRLGPSPIHRKSFLVKYRLRQSQGSLV